LYPSIIAALLIIIVTQYLIIRYLSISPSFGIPVQAVGRFRMMVATGEYIWAFADVDFLGKINDALSSIELGQIGMIRWNEIMTWVLQNIRADDLFLVYGGDEFGLGLKVGDRRWTRKHQDPHAFCERFQQLLREYPYFEEWEKQALIKAIGTPYATVTIAWVYSSSRKTHRSSFLKAHQLVLAAKPKDGRIGDRGKILSVTSAVDVVHLAV
jgi:GGDEF domain-containing protein